MRNSSVSSLVWLQFILKLSQQTQSSYTCRASGFSWPIQPFVLWQNFTGNFVQILFDLYQLISRKRTHVLASFPSLQRGKEEGRNFMWGNNHGCFWSRLKHLKSFWTAVTVFHMFLREVFTRIPVTVVSVMGSYSIFCLYFPCSFSNSNFSCSYSNSYHLQSEKTLKSSSLLSSIQLSSVNRNQCTPM